MDKFEFAADTDTAAAMHSKMLAFKEKLRTLRIQGDSNGNNIYEVTVQASDTVNTTPAVGDRQGDDADEDGRGKTCSTQRRGGRHER